MFKRLKSILINKNIMTHLFYLFVISIFLCASFSPLKTLFEKNAFYTILLLIIVVVSIYVLKYILKKINVEKKELEYVIVFVLILIGLLLRVGTNRIIKTQPVSDFNTPHRVYELLHTENSNIFEPKASYQDLNFYQRYYSVYPAWFPYMKVVSFVYNIFGHNLRYIKIMNWGLYVVTAFLLYWITKKIKSKKTGFVALLLFSCFPSLIVYTNITTPDHFTILFFTCFIATWIKMLEYRKSKDKKLYLWSVLNIFSIIGINLFKPLSILGLLVFMCAELLYFIFPILKDKEKRHLYFKNSFAFSLTFIIVCFFAIQISNQLLNKTVEKTIHTKVVDSTPLYLLWAYSLDENGNYNPNIATKTYSELQLKYEFDQKKVMEEISILAKEQIIKNIPKMHHIFYQKFRVVFASEGDVFSFANHSHNEAYEQMIREKFKKYYTYLSNMFMSVLFFLCILSFVKEIKSKEKNPMMIVITLTVIGYFLILLLGGVQGRYKMLMTSLLCILAGTAFQDTRKEEEVC